MSRLAGDLDNVPELGLSEEVFAGGAAAVPTASADGDGDDGDAGGAAGLDTSDVIETDPESAEAAGQTEVGAILGEEIPPDEQA